MFLVIAMQSGCNSYNFLLECSCTLLFFSLRWLFLAVVIFIQLYITISYTCDVLH